MARLLGRTGGRICLRPAAAELATLMARIGMRFAAELSVVCATPCRTYRTPSTMPVERARLGRGGTGPEPSRHGNHPFLAPGGCVRRAARGLGDRVPAGAYQQWFDAAGGAGLPRWRSLPRWIPWARPGCVWPQPRDQKKGYPMQQPEDAAHLATKGFRRQAETPTANSRRTPQRPTGTRRRSATDFPRWETCLPACLRLHPGEGAGNGARRNGHQPTCPNSAARVAARARGTHGASAHHSAGHAIGCACRAPAPSPWGHAVPPLTRRRTCARGTAPFRQRRHQCQPPAVLAP